MDTLYEKVRVDKNGHRDIIAIKPMVEESRDSYGVLFQNLKERGLTTSKLFISDAHSCLVCAIRESFPGSSWQRCKIHFMRSILSYVPQREEGFFAAVLKEIWQAPTVELTRKRVCDIIDT